MKTFCSRLCCLLLLLFLLQVSPSLAGEGLARSRLTLSNINTKEGLSSAHIFSIVEADDGAMWIGTKYGADRYNGRTVTNYSLPGGRNIKLLKENHRLYAYDNTGRLYVYDKGQDAFSLKWDIRQQMNASVAVNDIVFDRHGSCWLATTAGVYVLSPDGKGRRLLQDVIAYHLCFVGSRLLVSSSKGLFVYTADGARPTALGIQCQLHSSFHDAARHQVWLGTNHQGVLVLDDRTLQPVAVPGLQTVPNVPVRSFLSYDRRTLLIGVDGAGVYAYDRQAHEARLLLNTDGHPSNSLHGNGVYALCKDRLGDLWIGTYSGGVDLAMAVQHSLEYVTHDYLNPQSLADNIVNDVFQSRDGKLWYATDKGVSIFDPRTARWSHGLRGKVALTLCQTARGDMLVGTYVAGVYRMDAAGRATPLYSIANGKLKSDYVYSLIPESDGGLWIGCLDGNLTHIAPDGRCTYLPVTEVQCMVETPDRSHVAVGSSQGCLLIDKSTHSIRRFFYEGQFSGCDYNYLVDALLFLDARHVWIGTDGGAYLYDLGRNTVTRYGREQGLPSDAVTSLSFDPDGRRVWIGTDRGLAFVENGRVMNLNFFEGLEREYMRMAVTRTRSGVMLFGSSTGAVALSPQFARSVSYHAPLHINRVLQEGNIVTVHYESINYPYQHDIQYQYWLEGYDRGWSELSDVGTARFVRLPPGHYTLRVRAVGRSNRRVLDQQSLQLRIPQPWWNTWWAWCLYLCLVGLLAYMGWNYYRERLQRRYYAEKIRFVVNTAHNIRTPLSLVLAPLADMAREKDLSRKCRDFMEMAQRNGERLMAMITELLDFEKMNWSPRDLQRQKVQLPELLSEPSAILRNERPCAQPSDDPAKDILLFVDDNADLRQYFRMAFGEAYRVVDVESGEAALEYLDGGECDLIVSDVMMPGMHGDELCRRIKNDERLSWLPVILLTAKAGREFMIEGLELGADDYITKPFDPRILAGKIDSMLKNRRRLSRYYMQRSLGRVRDTQPEAAQPEDSQSEADTAGLNDQDRVFIDRVTQLVLDNLQDSDFTIDSLCREMAMSRTPFYGKLKTLTGRSPADFVRIIRLEQAAGCLKQGLPVQEVSVKTGFVNAKHFSTVFKKHFGVSPSKYKG